MQKVVIFGSEGMLGSALKKRFSDFYQVIGLDFKDVDITNFVQLESRLKEVRPEIIINTAAYNNVDEVEVNNDKFELAKKINGTAVGKMASITKSLGSVLVHFSSEYVFDGTNKKGYLEDAEPNPINKYGETKALGEKLLQANTDKFYLVRLSRMFGPAGISEKTKKSFVDKMIELGDKKGELKVVNEEVSCPTYSLDLADLVFEIIQKKLEFGIYHGSNSGACTWYELANEAFKIKGLKANLIPVQSSEFPRPAKRPMCGELMNTKLPKNRPWQDALADYLR